MYAAIVPPATTGESGDWRSGEGAATAPALSIPTVDTPAALGDTATLASPQADTVGLSCNGVDGGGEDGGGGGGESARSMAPRLHVKTH